MAISETKGRVDSNPDPFNSAVLLSSRNKGHANIKGFTLTVKAGFIKSCLSLPFPKIVLVGWLAD